MSDGMNPTPIQETSQKLAANEIALRQQQQAQSGPASFKASLEQAQANTRLKFSAHAQERLQSRNIQLSQQTLNKLGEAVDKASAKGGRESLILMDNLALVVSVKNRVVITAVDGPSMKDNVFTNIDSAVVM